MKKITSILIAIMLFIMAGCLNKEVIEYNYTYKGENKFWASEYKVNGTSAFINESGKTEYSSKCDKVLTVTYKKNISDLSSAKQLEISYQSSVGSGKLTVDLSNNPSSEKTFTLKSGSIGGAIESKDETIIVNINLDGSIQTIELKNVN